MKYGYARVSTQKQGTDGNSLEDQEKKLREAGAEEIVSDTFTGTKIDRPEFSKLIKKLGAGDELIVTKLDRFARTAVEGGQIVRDLLDRGVSVNILNLGLLNNTPTGKLIFSVFLSFAEFERDMIVERTQAGKQIARERGVRVDGRPEKFSKKQIEHALDLLDEYPYSEVERMTGISVSTLVRAKRKRKAAESQEG